MACGVEGKKMITIHNNCGFLTVVIWRERNMQPVIEIVESGKTINLSSHSSMMIAKKANNVTHWLVENLLQGDFDIDDSGLWSGKPGQHVKLKDEWGNLKGKHLKAAKGFKGTEGWFISNYPDIFLREKP